MFDTMLASYTIFHQDTKTFSNLWTEYYCKYEDFCKAYEDDMLKYANQRGLFVTANVLKNNFPVSMILWTLFKGSNLNFQKSYGFLQSIFTMDKYYKENRYYIAETSKAFTYYMKDVIDKENLAFCHSKLYYKDIYSFAGWLPRKNAYKPITIKTASTEKNTELLSLKKSFKFLLANRIILLSPFLLLQ